MRKKTEDEQENGSDGVSKVKNLQASQKRDQWFLKPGLYCGAFVKWKHCSACDHHPSLLCRSGGGRFPAFSFSSQSSDESCTSTPLIIWGSAQTNMYFFQFPLLYSAHQLEPRQGILSLILPSKNGKKKDNMKTSLQRSKRKKLVGIILFCSEVFCGSSNSPFKGKIETAATPDIVWFYLSQQVGSVCSS